MTLCQSFCLLLVYQFRVGGIYVHPFYQFNSRLFCIYKKKLKISVVVRNAQLHSGVTAIRKGSDLLYISDIIHEYSNVYSTPSEDYDLTLLFLISNLFYK